MDRALPGHMIDLIRDGVPQQVLVRQGHRAVYNALVRTAASAQQRGHSRVDWESLVNEPGSALGRQNRSDAGGREDSPKRSRGRLAKAWTEAARWVSEAPPPWSREAAQEHATQLASDIGQAIADPDNGLSDNERRILEHVAAVAGKRGSDRLTLTRAALLEATGLGLTALRTALGHLDRRGLLVLVEAGAPRTRGKPKRANVYRLSALTQSGDPVSSAPTDLAVPPSLVPPGVSGAPPQAQQINATDQETAMDSITLTHEQIVTALGETALANLLAAQTHAPPERHLSVVPASARSEGA